MPDFNPSETKSSPAKSEQKQSGWQNYAGDYGFGLGRLFNTGYKKFAPKTTPADFVLPRQFSLGLKEAFTELEFVIENLYKNPKDPQWFDNIHQVADKYNHYFSGLEVDIEDFLKKPSDLGYGEYFAKRVIDFYQYLVPSNELPILKKRMEKVQHLQERLARLPDSQQKFVLECIPLLAIKLQENSPQKQRNTLVMSSHLRQSGKNSKKENKKRNRKKKRDALQAPSLPPFGPTFNISDINGANGFAINSQSNITFVNEAGDINDDGIDDFLVVANDTVHVIYGRQSGFGGQFNLSSINGINGFVIPGRNLGFFGRIPSKIRDMNGDGISELLVRKRSVCSVWKSSSI